MARLDAVFNALHSEGLLNRFEASCVLAAIDILREDPGTDNHVARLAFANSVIGPDGESYARSVAKRVIRYAISTDIGFGEKGEDFTDSEVVNLTLSALKDSKIFDVVK